MGGEIQQIKNNGIIPATMSAPASKRPNASARRAPRLRGKSAKETAEKNLHTAPAKKSIEEICEVVRSLADYPPGWDGEKESVAPAKADIENAVDFIRRIPFRITQPKAMIAGDGDVGFVWRSGADFLEVGFTGGEISYGAKLSGERLFDDLPYKRAGIPPKLLGLIQEIAAE